MKRLLFHIFLTIIIAVSAMPCAVAQVRSVEERLVVDIPFVLAKGEVRDMRFDIDSVALAQSILNLQRINRDKTMTIKSIEFYSSVSPEGRVHENKILGKKRLASAEIFVRNHLHIPDSIEIKRTERYIPWKENLLLAIQNDKSVPYRDQLLALVSRESDENGEDSRLADLKTANGGRLWEVVRDRYFERMRKGGVIVVVERPVVDLAIDKKIELPADVMACDVVPVRRRYVPMSGTETALLKKQAAPQIERSQFAISLKTNALGWGLAISNIAVEFDFAKHVSLSLPLYYSALNYFTPTIKFRVLATQPELRCWIKENNTGFFVGAHFGVASYNIAVKGLERYQDHNGNSPAIGGGIGVGYRMPISKNEKWNLEFALGVGAYQLHYDTFYNVENGRLIDTYKKTYWGIDNAAVNISYRFDFKKKSRK